MTNKKSIPMFQAADKKIWEKFSTETNNFYDQQKFSRLETLSPSLSHINYLWDELKRLIIFCDNKVIPH
jgi:hypothetical protein